MHHQVAHGSLQHGEYDVEEAVRWKGYHQCVALLPRTLPLTSCLPSRGLQAYYKLLLRGHKAEPYQPNSTYVVALNADKKKRGEELEAFPIEDGSPDGNADEIRGARPLGHVEPERPKRPSTPSSWRQKAGTASGSKDPAPIPLPAPPDPIVCLGPPGALYFPSLCACGALGSDVDFFCPRDRLGPP